jgi:hypothetical protein
MSTLQVSLAIIGGLILAGVVAYNAWITRRNVPRTLRERGGEADAASGGPAAPVFADTSPGAEVDGRIDPVLDAMPGDVPAAAPFAEPATPQAVPVTLNHMVATPEKRPGLDALIDVITPLTLETEVSGDALLAALPGTRRVGSKPFAVEGLSEMNGEWETPRPGQRYRALQAGVQLANRAGALNDIEFSEFVVKAQTFADAVGAAPDFPDMRAEVARARELDAFASGHDAQLGFTLRAGSAAGQAPILSLAFDPQAAMAEDPELSALRELALSLEVTHVARIEQPFVRMREAAAALAEAMDGVVTDDAGQPLTAEALDRIGADLEGLYDALDSRDLSAGSAQARRLFS